MNTTQRSSLQAAASDPSSSVNGNAAFTSAAAKKKLGQNLSKLTKPPAPPVPTGAKANASSRNGLLLLSTKRSSSLTSNNVSSVSSSAGGGILSGKSSSSAAAACTNVALSNASTNDALFQAAVGRMDSQQQQQQLQPDAWGVAASTEKQKPDVISEVKQPEPVLAPQGGVSSSFMQPHVSPLPRTHDNHNQTRYMEAGQKRYDGPTGSSPRFDADGRQFSGINGHRHYDDHNRNRSLYEPVDSNRGYQENFHAHSNTTKQNPGDDHGAFVRERAEARRAEEEARIHEQKERAGQRLRELEEKMAKNAERTPVVLETLSAGSGGLGSNGRPQQQSWQTPDRNQQRTLFDPNSVTYSALVGGSSQRENGEIQVADQEARSGNGTSPPVRKVEPGHDNVVTQSQYAGPVIHLSSYEDRDRGERGNAAGPKMLFDPKSGSMVAVPVREDASRGRKDRTKRVKNDRESPTVTVLKKPESTSDADYDSTTDKNHRRRSSRNRKDDVWQPKGKGRSDSTDTPVRGEAKKKHGNSRRTSERTLPRTCGVLYARDEKGNCYPVDGCDGDLGYGAYSVPGGPTRNHEAYAKFLEKHQNYRRDAPDDVVDDYLGDADQYNSQQEDAAASRGVTLQTGFKISEPLPASKIIDWVKPNEKIELVTGVDDSPTLQATAREWAPSRAALAAAKAVAVTGPTTATIVKENKSVVTEPVPLVTPAAPKSTVVLVEDVQEEEDVPFLGLGFDPTETMDSVIQSPSIRSQKTGGFDVDLAALSLDPPLNATSRNIFAFGSSATWGNSGDSGNSGWGDLGVGSLNNGFLSSRFSKEGKDVAATFLSLSDKGWGGTGVIGLGGGALSGKPAETTGE